MSQMSEELKLMGLEGQKRLDARIRQLVARGNFLDALTLANADDRPGMLRDWWEKGLLERQTLQQLFPEAWPMIEAPRRSGIKWWVKAFKAAGFVSDREGMRPPNAVLTVYRGCFPMFRFGLAWTTNKQRADWFAHEYSAKRYVYPPDIDPRWTAPPAVYRAKVAPRHILAMFYEREEEEVVVNPWGLARIERIG